MTAADVLARYRRYGWSATTGEWGYIQAETRRYLRAALEAGDEAEIDRQLGVMFREGACCGLLSFAESEVAAKPDLLRASVDVNLRVWGGGEEELHLLKAPDVGRPPLVVVNGTGMLFDTPRHDHYARRIATLLPMGGTVLEIGGGYGGTVLQLLRRTQGVNVVLCDLPETLYLAWYWLSHAGVTVAWHDEPELADVTLVPAQELEQYAGTPDLVFSAHALSEMPGETVARYMAWIAERKPFWFYHDDAVGVWGEPGSTASDYPETLADAMVPDGYRCVFRVPTHWPRTGLRYCEIVYARTT